MILNPALATNPALSMTPARPARQASGKNRVRLEADAAWSGIRGAVDRRPFRPPGERQMLKHYTSCQTVGRDDRTAIQLPWRVRRPRFRPPGYCIMRMRTVASASAAASTHLPIRVLSVDVVVATWLVASQ